MKRQQVYEMAEHRAEDYGRAVQHQGPSRMSYRESGFYVQQDRDPNERAYPENMEMSYEERGLPAVYSHQYPAPGEMQMDRGPQPSLQLHQGYQHSAAWHTQVPFVVVPQPQHQQQPPQPEEEEEKKPRKVWWYTTCRVFSAVLIILNLVSDWLQYSDMSDPVGDIKEILSGKKGNLCQRSKDGQK
ncbi:uncharacterized protein LOC134244652 [Saccostrea cucullata]|uniref:uncharacterized protein LOC134244652 n=1 Tax=Saccostrea cuccullata TaxID=36930 RepID=UPI002ED444C4